MRAVILAGGRGTRMQRADPSAALDPAQMAAAGEGLKAMVPDSRGRPFLDHVLSGLADAGVREVCLVVPPDAAAVRAHYTREPPQRVTLSYAVQPMPLGTADAVVCAAAWTGDAPFLVLNADNLYPAPALRALVSLGEPGLVGFTADGLVAEGAFEPERVAAFAILHTHADGTLDRIEEKPATLPSDAFTTALISMNLWRFDASIHRACREVPVSARGERELPEAVALAIRGGDCFRVVTLRATVLDLSHRRDIAGVAHRLGARDISP